VFKDNIDDMSEHLIQKSENREMSRPDCSGDIILNIALPDSNFKLVQIVARDRNGWPPASL
jgi:hypothetical protein